MQVTQESIVRRDPQLISANMGDEVVMLNANTGEYLGLDRIGGRIWSKLEEPVKVEALCRELLEEYQVEWEQCLGDVVSLLNQLYASKAIQVTADRG